VRGLKSSSPYPNGDKLGKATDGPNFVGNVFYGSEGVVVCPNYNSGIAFRPDGEIITKFSGGGDDTHFANFVRASAAGRLKT